MLSIGRRTCASACALSLDAQPAQLDKLVRRICLPEGEGGVSVIFLFYYARPRAIGCLQDNIPLACLSLKWKTSLWGEKSPSCLGAVENPTHKVRCGPPRGLRNVAAHLMKVISNYGVAVGAGVGTAVGTAVGAGVAVADEPVVVGRLKTNGELLGRSMTWISGDSLEM